MWIAVAHAHFVGSSELRNQTASCESQRERTYATTAAACMLNRPQSTDTQLSDFRATELIKTGPIGSQMDAVVLICRNLWQIYTDRFYNSIMTSVIMCCICYQSKIEWFCERFRQFVYDTKQQGTFHSARWKCDYSPDLCWPGHLR